MKKQFIAQIGSNNTVKLFEVGTGNLYRIINVDGNITSQPICTENEMYVTVTVGGSSVIKFFALPGGGLKKTVPINSQEA